MCLFEALPETENPLSATGLEKLKGHQHYYKKRFDEYRLGLRIDRRRREVTLCRVLHRRDIYRRFP